MTTLAGYQGEDFACLVADSQITEDNLKTISTSTPKIIKRGKYLIGIVGDSRPGDILTYNWKPPVYKLMDDPIQHMGTRVIPSVISAFNENNYPWNSLDKDGGFDYLIAFDGHLFHIACDMSFIKTDHGIYGLGTGGQFAMGHLWASRDGSADKNWDKKLARKYLTSAVKCATILDVNTALPVQVEIQERGSASGI